MVRYTFYQIYASQNSWQLLYFLVIEKVEHLKKKEKKDLFLMSY